MFLSVKSIPHPIPPADKPDPKTAQALQEGLGGQFGEMRTMMQYFFQNMNFREDAKPYQDLLRSMATEKMGHVEQITNNKYKEEIIQINPVYETEESVRQVLYKGYKGMNTDKVDNEDEDEEKSLMIFDSLRKYSGQKNAESIWNANQEMVKYANGLGKNGVYIM
ncbi:MAG: manganese catalase family protein [Candidatus Nitrosocosmicus sp.]|nr:manganese catalase family protein [Candidatus Nitrosocosmicus sp.]